MLDATSLDRQSHRAAIVKNRCSKLLHSSNLLKVSLLRNFMTVTAATKLLQVLQGSIGSWSDLQLGDENKNNFLRMHFF